MLANGGRYTAMRVGGYRLRGQLRDLVRRIRCVQIVISTQRLLCIAITIFLRLAMLV